MNKIIVGSVAAKYWFDDFRRPRDLDIVTEDEVFLDGKTSFCSHQFYEYISEYCQGPIASPEVLYTIKLSHCFWPIHLSKTLADIEFFQSRQVEYLPELFWKLYSMWQKVHRSKKHISLRKSKEEFFNGNVLREMDHDTLHDVLKYGLQPLYQLCLVEGEEVLFDFAKFQQFPFDSQLQCVREELYVLAIERNNLEISRCNDDKDLITLGKELYRKELCNFLTRYSKGKFALWVALHYTDLKNPDCNYLLKYLEWKESYERS